MSWRPHDAHVRQQLAVNALRILSVISNGKMAQWTPTTRVAGASTGSEVVRELSVAGLGVSVPQVCLLSNVHGLMPLWGSSTILWYD